MKLIIKSGEKLKKEFELKCSPDELTAEVDKFLPSIETQLHVSIDYVVCGDTAEFMCDSCLNPMLFDFICTIAQTELKKKNLI